MSYSVQTINDAARVAALCATATHTKAAIQRKLNIGPARAQRALDYCKREGLITQSPFMCILENGEWKYGYRHKALEILQNMRWDLGYSRTRLFNRMRYVHHTLISKDPRLIKSLPRKQRKMYKNLLTAGQGMVATLDLVMAEIERELAP